MKVVCEGCHAKYQIPDERVAGRKIKIRCRRCAQAIVVRGDLLGGDTELGTPAPIAASPAPASIEWHVSVGGEQHGPYAPEQMLEMLQAGHLTRDMHVWREGYADWTLVSDAPELMQTAQPPAEEPLVNLEVAPDEHPTQVLLDEEPTRTHQSQAFAPGDQLRPTATRAFAAQQASGATAAGAAAATSAESSLAQSPRVSVGQAMTGERHENSVLFSAGNLQASEQTQAPSQGAGYASGEGSGLIDIRALAALTSQSSVSQSPGNGHLSGTKSTNGNGADRDLMNLAQQTSTFANMDSLLPVDRPVQRNSSALAIGVFAGLAMIGLFGAVAAIIIYKPGTPVAPAVAMVANESPATPSAPASPVEEQPAEETAAAEPAEESEEAKAAAEEPAEEPAVEADKADKAEAKRSQPERAKVAAAPVRRKARAEARAKRRAEEPEDKSDDPLEGLLKSDAPKKEEANKPAESKAAASDIDLLGGGAASAAKTQPEAKQQPASNRSIDDLLDTAVDEKKAAAADLPVTPGRADVLKAMRSVEPAVRECAKGEEISGTAAVALTVAGPTGRISGVRVTGIQGQVGSCIARAVRAASFPRFSKADFKITYPYKFR